MNASVLAAAAGLAAVAVGAGCTPDPALRDRPTGRRRAAARAERPAPPPPTLDAFGVTWRLACAGCADVTITLWNDGKFWVRRRVGGAAAEIWHGWWERRDSSAAAAEVALYAGAGDRPTFVLEERAGAMRLRSAPGGLRGVRLPVPLTRAPSADPIDEPTTFAGTWDAYVHDMRLWHDCHSQVAVRVEGDVRPDFPDSAYALRGAYRHWVGAPEPLPPEFEDPGRPARGPALVLHHAFVAERLVGGLGPGACPGLTR